MKNDQKYLDELRHSAAHLLAAAVLELWPDAKPTLGPPVENGFYYDFDFGDVKISEEDFPKIEKVMKKILPTWKEFIRTEIANDDAKVLFSENQYKHELIKEISERSEALTIYSPCSIPKPYTLPPKADPPPAENSAPCFYDLCRGGHVENPSKELKAFKLLSVAGAYWRGDEKNKMLTRIYGTAFPTKDELVKHLAMLEEAKKRDHRKLGKELDLFAFSELVGPGLPLFTPRGTLIRKELENYIAELRAAAGFEQVWIPHIAKNELYKTSGHWEKFEDDIFHVKSKKAETGFVIKPMNCPHHTQIFTARPRSYKDMPIRYAETTTIYRDENTGQLQGLSRVRSITQDDSHVFCRADQIEAEARISQKLITTLYDALGIELKIRLSTHDPEKMEKYLGTEKSWQEAEQNMENMLKKDGREYFVGVGEAAFYGPKIDYIGIDSLGREWQLATVQLDTNQPHRFELSYINEKGVKEEPVMIHVAVMGSTERFMAILIEHFAGAFPTWLAPEQVRVVPISEKFSDYATTVKKALKTAGVRVTLDDSSETLGKRIRAGETQKIPYLLIVGEKEASAETVNVRTRREKDQREEKLADFVKKIVTEISQKQL
jgi:threonyl-tRNA synthetase